MEILFTKKISSFLWTVLGKLKKKFHYRVKIPRAETIFLALNVGGTEEESGWHCSRLFQDNFTLNVMDPCGEKAFTMTVSSRMTCMLSKLHVSSENSKIQPSQFTVCNKKTNVSLHR